MSFCTPCTNIGLLYICYDELEIGTVDNADTLYYIYFMSLANGFIVKYSATSDSNGLLTIESTGGFVLSENTGYEIWVNQTDDQSDKEEFQINGITNECFMTNFKRGVKPTPTSTVQRSIYVSLTGILGSATPTTNLKNWSVSKGITNPILYLAALLDNGTNRTSMRTLNTELNTLGITKRSANVTQSTNAINEADAGTPAAYNVGCTTAAEKFTNFSQEWEFWKSNPYGDFATFKTNDLAIYNWCLANNVKYDIYVARCKDVAGVSTPEQVASWLVTYHDTIYLVDYVSTEKFNTYSGLSDGIKAQIQLFANAAKAAGKVQKMQILWASEGNVVSGVPTNMYTYFVANPTLIPAYNTFKVAYDAWIFANKTSINFLGQNIYAYDSIKSL